MSVLVEILDAVVADHLSANLSINGNLLSVVKRKLPKKEDTVDADYQVTVSGAEMVDRITPIAFGGSYKVSYRVEMTLIVPNDRDQLVNLDAVANWREATRVRYMVRKPLPVDAVKQVTIVEGVFFDRTLLREGCDYDQVVIELITYETRG